MNNPRTKRKKKVKQNKTKKKQQKLTNCNSQNALQIWHGIHINSTQSGYLFLIGMPSWCIDLEAFSCTSITTRDWVWISLGDPYI